VWIADTSELVASLLMTLSGGRGLERTAAKPSFWRARVRGWRRLDTLSRAARVLGHSRKMELI
jgi:hypothetical protein